MFQLTDAIDFLLDDLNVGLPVGDVMLLVGEFNRFASNFFVMDDVGDTTNGTSDMSDNRFMVDSICLISTMMYVTLKKNKIYKNVVQYGQFIYINCFLSHK